MTSVRNRVSRVFEVRFEEGNFLFAVLCLLVFICPFFLNIQQHSDETAYIYILGPFWLYWTAFEPAFHISPLPLLVYFPFYAPSFYFAKVARDAVSKRFSGCDYYSRAGRGIIVHLMLLVFFCLGSSGTPEPIEIAFPIVGLIALLIGPSFVKDSTTLWSEESGDEMSPHQ